jgi:AbrB family looped-hinge helix DNA binding protein
LPVQFELKLQKVGNSLRLTIPRPVVDGLGLKAGDILVLSVGGGDEIKVRKLRKDGRR